ncbi:hypothetical protein AB1N83_012792 [Pleurotus pulmonarius]
MLHINIIHKRLATFRLDTIATPASTHLKMEGDGREKVLPQPDEVKLDTTTPPRDRALLPVCLTPGASGRVASVRRCRSISRSPVATATLLEDFRCRMDDRPKAKQVKFSRLS